MARSLGKAASWPTNAFAWAVTLVSSPAFSQCTSYSIELILPPCSPGNTIAHAISSDGVVAGDYGCVLFDDRAFLWNDGILTIVPVPAGMPDAQALAVNSLGDAVGWMANDVVVHEHAFLFTDGEVVDLGVLPGANFSVALSINEASEVCGYSGNSATGDPPLQAFLWVDGTMTGVKLPLGPYGVASAVNNSSQLCGWMGTSQNRVPFVWSDGEAVQIPIPSGAFAGEATANNDLGDVCGVFYFPGQVRVPFVFVDGSATELELLPQTSSGFAHDLNDQGVVVGWCGGTTSPQACVWIDGEPHNLNDLVDNGIGINLQAAKAISNQGQIAADAVMPGGQARSVRLTPLAPLAGDVNCDRLVNVDDLIGVISDWGDFGGPADLNRDRIVDLGDLLIVLDNWS